MSPPDVPVLDGIFPDTRKPVIGMVHLADLYTPLGLNYLADRARADALNLYQGGNGVDGIIVENWEERSGNPFVTDETVERMVTVIDGVADLLYRRAPIGVNVLHNDYRAAFGIACELSLPFVQLDVYVDSVRTDFGHTDVPPFEVVVDVADVHQHRRGSGAALFVSVHPKHYRLLEEKTIETSTRQAIDSRADAVCVTKLTGTAPDVIVLKRVKECAEQHRSGFPVILASGAHPANIAELAPYFDAVIVGSALKIGGDVDNPVDPQRVEAFMHAYERIR